MGSAAGPFRDDARPSPTALVFGWAVGGGGFVLAYRLGDLLLPGRSWSSDWSIAGLALTSAAAQVAGGLAFFGSTRGLDKATRILAMLPLATAPMALDLAKRGNSPAVVILACAGMVLFWGPRSAPGCSCWT